MAKISESETGLEIQEIGGATHNYDEEVFDLVARQYAEAFKILQKRGVSPSSVFVGGCGSGADIFGVHHVWPDAEICAVDVQDRPREKVFKFCGEKLNFKESSILSEIEDRIEKGDTFDLIVIFDIASDEYSFVKSSI